MRDGEGCGVGVVLGEGVGLVVGIGLGVGVGAAAAVSLQISFLPCLVQIKLVPFDFFTCPTFVHEAPALTAAFVWIEGSEISVNVITESVSFFRFKFIRTD